MVTQQVPTLVSIAMTKLRDPRPLGGTWRSAGRWDAVLALPSLLPPPRTTLPGRPPLPFSVKSVTTGQAAGAFSHLNFPLPK